MGKYEFGVEMTCSGCSNAVNRVLSRLQGVKDKDINLDSKTVVVDTDPSLSLQQVHDVIAKTGKKILYSKELA